MSTSNLLTVYTKVQPQRSHLLCQSQGIDDSSNINQSILSLPLSLLSFPLFSSLLGVYQQTRLIIPQLPCLDKVVIRKTKCPLLQKQHLCIFPCMVWTRSSTNTHTHTQSKVIHTAWSHWTDMPNSLGPASTGQSWHTTRRTYFPHPLPFTINGPRQGHQLSIIDTFGFQGQNIPHDNSIYICSIPMHQPHAYTHFL